jgi:hypothetical protein
LEPVPPRAGWQVMKNTPKAKPHWQEDDIWTWVVIGSIFGAVMLTLYGPLIWQ